LVAVKDKCDISDSASHSRDVFKYSKRSTSVKLGACDKIYLNKSSKPCHSVITPEIDGNFRLGNWKDDILNKLLDCCKKEAGGLSFWCDIRSL